ncbi:zinc transporter 9 isoform X1 [Drosophila rhopaloa]|uniref:Proton-coupled zinc antiporter SLC30A9, mitochondrial n=1 Tax=Drosophila rhopaloa TaxID=1041015 RepID=A0ABM5GTA3_DRORH|nr:zinc transporter 9 isoform X1 [Drosophila rhopaloa]XP_016968895.2 zinc transporter 9 isoform X1 [Drosophila rhopaloa]
MLMRGVQLLQRRHQQLRRAFSQCSLRHDAGNPWRRNDSDFSRPHPWKRPGMFLQFRCSAGGSDSKKKDELALKETTARPAAQPKEKQTKNFEVKTSKGILSISTTIEDSKINEIVFEKSDLPPVSKLKEPALAAAAINLRGSSTVGATSGVGLGAGTFMNPPETMPSQPAPTSALSEAALIAKAGEAASAPLPPLIEVPPPMPVLPPKRPRFDYRASLERNFVTPNRAISDFLLTAADLESLPKIKRRSPYEQEPPMTVYWRRDVEAKAVEVWGSKENLLRERLKREVERKQYQQIYDSADLFTVKRRLRDYRREMGSRTKVMLDNRKESEKSGQVVATAIAINAANLLFKAGGWLYSGSHSMFAEVIHSLADLINQLILAFGIYKSSQSPDIDHPYGYMNMRYVSSLISGVGIFCVGCGLSIYHGIDGILHPEPIADLFWVYCILAGSLVSEGATLVVAINELKRAAKENSMTFKDYVISGKDPCVNVVLCEDAAAVTGVMVAGACMGLSSYTGSPIFDAAGSLVIGALLGAVASFIIYTNANALVGISIASERLEKINSALEADVMIRAIYDVKGIDIGNARVRYKAELDFDGRELTRSYLDKQDLAKLLTTVRGFEKVEDLEGFLLDQGENIVDLMGGEIDRIEMNLRTQFPEIRHVDLEIL